MPMFWLEAFENHGKIELAFIFGSYVKGTLQAHSDIDLFVLGKTSFTTIVESLIDLHEQLGREINPVIMHPAEFRKKCHSDPFLQRVAKESKIYVMGGADDFAKLVGDRTAQGI